MGCAASVAPVDAEPIVPEARSPKRRSAASDVLQPLVETAREEPTLVESVAALERLGDLERVAAALAGSGIVGTRRRWLRKFDDCFTALEGATALVAAADPELRRIFAEHWALSHDVVRNLDKPLASAQPPGPPQRTSSPSTSTNRESKEVAAPIRLSHSSPHLQTAASGRDATDADAAAVAATKTAARGDKLELTPSNHAEELICALGLLQRLVDAGLAHELVTSVSRAQFIGDDSLLRLGRDKSLAPGSPRSPREAGPWMPSAGGAVSATLSAGDASAKGAASHRRNASDRLALWLEAKGKRPSAMRVKAQDGPDGECEATGEVPVVLRGTYRLMHMISIVDVHNKRLTLRDRTQRAVRRVFLLQGATYWRSVVEGDAAAALQASTAAESACAHASGSPRAGPGGAAPEKGSETSAEELSVDDGAQPPQFMLSSNRRNVIASERTAEAQAAAQAATAAGAAVAMVARRRGAGGDGNLEALGTVLPQSPTLPDDLSASSKGASSPVCDDAASSSAQQPRPSVTVTSQATVRTQSVQFSMASASQFGQIGGDGAWAVRHSSLRPSELPRNATLPSSIRRGSSRGRLGASAAAAVFAVHLVTPDMPLFPTTFFFPSRDERQQFIELLLMAGVKFEQGAAAPGLRREFNRRPSVTQSSLGKLHQVLESPAMLQAFWEFAVDQIAEENISFIENVMALRHGCELPQHKAAALTITNFFDRRARSCINVSESFFNWIAESARLGVHPMALLDEAARVVENELILDLFSRFVASPQFFLLSSSEEQRAIYRRRSELLRGTRLLNADIENTSQLLVLVELFSSSGALRPMQYLLAEEERCFHGRALVTWLVENCFVQNRDQGYAVGCRLMTAGLVSQVDDAVLFRDDDTLFRLTELSRPPIGEEAELYRAWLRQNAEKWTRRENRLLADYVLVGGFKFVVFYAVLSAAQPPLLLFFRSHTCEELVHSVQLEGASGYALSFSAFTDPETAAFVRISSFFLQVPKNEATEGSFMMRLRTHLPPPPSPLPSSSSSSSSAQPRKAPAPAPQPLSSQPPSPQQQQRLASPPAGLGSPRQINMLSPPLGVRSLGAPAPASASDAPLHTQLEALPRPLSEREWINAFRVAGVQVTTPNPLNRRSSGKEWNETMQRLMQPSSS